MRIFRCFRCSKRWLIEQPSRSRAKNKCPACDGILNLERRLYVISRRKKEFRPSSFFRYFVRPIGEESNRFISFFLNEMQLSAQSLTVVIDERGEPINFWEIPSSVLGDVLSAKIENFKFKIFKCRKGETLKTGMKKI